MAEQCYGSEIFIILFYCYGFGLNHSNNTPHTSQNPTKILCRADIEKTTGAATDITTGETVPLYDTTTCKTSWTTAGVEGVIWYFSFIFISVISSVISSVINRRQNHKKYFAIKATIAATDITTGETVPLYDTTTRKTSWATAEEKVLFDFHFVSMIVGLSLVW